MYKYLLQAYRVLSYPFRAVSWHTELLRNFIIPNLSPIIQKRVKYAKRIRCAQRMYITGTGEVIIGEATRFGYKLGGYFKRGYGELQTRTDTAKIKIGKHVNSNNNIFICSCGNISIGDNCLIGQHVIIMDFEAHGIQPDSRDKVGYIGSVDIRDNVWIGNNVTILKDSVIGANSIVATGAVVSGKFPDNVVIGGVPARIVKQITR